MKKKPKKSQDKNLGLSKILFTNYLAWTANLGVVPLFLFLIFLLAPELFFLAALLLLVTHVLDTILKLLSDQIIKKFNYIKVTFVPVFGFSVKEIIAISLCIASLGYGHAQETESSEDFVMARGDTKIIKLNKTDKYSISNKEVISSKFDAKNLKLLIKATKIGDSTLTIYNKSGIPARYNLIVIQKSQDLKLTNLVNIVKTLHLKANNLGTTIVISGKIESPSSYFNLYHILKTHSDYLINQTQLDKKIKNQILGTIYNYLLKFNIDFVSCAFEESILSCHSMNNEKIDEAFLNNFENIFHFKINTYQIPNHQNLSVKFKIIQLEQLSGEEIRLGLEQLNSNLGEILNNSILNIVNKNQFLLKENNLSLNTLAEPKITTQAGVETLIQIGSEIPYTQTNKTSNTTQTDWKFSGLKIKLKLERYKDDFNIAYENELTKPDSDSQTNISGSKEKSFLSVKKNMPVKLFEITIKTVGKNYDQLPLLSHIPILGEIFKSKSNSENYKTITAIMEISENE
jgi:Flp pilus assembly secretin CpaC